MISKIKIRIALYYKFFLNTRKNSLEKIEKKIIEVFYYGNYILLKKFYSYQEIDILTLSEIFFSKNYPLIMKKVKFHYSKI